MTSLNKIWYCRSISFKNVHAIQLHGFCCTAAKSGPYWYGLKEPGIRDEMPSETASYLLQVTEVKRICSRSAQHPDQSPEAFACHCQEAEAGLVQACHSTWHIARQFSSDVWREDVDKASRKRDGWVKKWTGHQLSDYWKGHISRICCSSWWPPNYWKQLKDKEGETVCVR